MKTVKTNYLMVLLLAMAILAPMSALGSPRDDATAGPLDDQPWGGEIDNTDYKTGNINSIIMDPNPSQFDITTIRNLGTPMVLFDYLQFFIFDYTVNTGSSSYIQEVNISTNPKSNTYTPLTTKTKRFSIRKGR